MQLNYEENHQNRGPGRPRSNQEGQQTRESDFMQNIDDCLSEGELDVEGALSGRDGGNPFNDKLNKTNVRELNGGKEHSLSNDIEERKSPSQLDILEDGAQKEDRVQQHIIVNKKANGSGRDNYLKFLNKSKGEREEKHFKVEIDSKWQFDIFQVDLNN